MQKLKQALFLSLCLSFLPHTSNAVAEDTVETLFKLDREFVQYRLKHGTYKAFSKYLAPNAVTLGPGVQPRVGLVEILSYVNDKPGQTTVWEPEAGEMVGDMGYTWGRFKIRMTKDGVTKVVQHGKYASTWKRQPNGEWKIVVDAFSLNDAPEK